MDTNVEKGFSALGGLFQLVINDLKNGMPLWEDFLTKAAKLHSQLKATILATSSFLDAFQKIADLATGTKGATKDIGTALTRIILRHKAVEARLKTFTSSIMDCLVLPLQEKMEEWKKSITQLDKDHYKEHKKARQEIKKRSSDTLRLQKKVRKGKCEVQRTLDNALQDVNDKFVLLEETEKHAVRMALIEERSHFCLLVACLKPVVDEEIAMLFEITHLQEILDQLLKHTSDPFTLPQASEQVIIDTKGSDGSWSFQTPPSSPSSIGSRKSSVCSISSLNSSSSGSTKSHSPSHQFRYRSHSQHPVPVGTFRLSSVSSQDSGFTSQDTLFLRPPTPPPLELARQVTSGLDQGNNSPETSSASTTPSSPYPSVIPSATATWPNLQETIHFDKTATTALILSERPHTISTAYERGHQRPALTVHTFDPPDRLSTFLPLAKGNHDVPNNSPTLDSPTPTGSIEDCPPLPERLATVEKPVPERPAKKHSSQPQQTVVLKEVLVPDFNQPAPNQVVPQPIYSNMDELKGEQKLSNTIEQIHKHMPQQAELAAALTQGLQQRIVHRSDSEGSTSHVSLLSSSGYGSQSTVATSSDDKLTADVEFVYDHNSMDEASKYCTMPRYTDHSQMLAHVIALKPSSAKGYPTSPMSGSATIGRSATLRRSNSQTHKPPLPIRRTSSITSQHGLSVVTLRNQQAGGGSAATLPRAGSTFGEGNGRGQLRQLSDNSLDNLIARKASLDSQDITLGRSESLDSHNHVPSARKASLGSQTSCKKGTLTLKEHKPKEVVVSQAVLAETKVYQTPILEKTMCQTPVSENNVTEPNNCVTKVYQKPISEANLSETDSDKPVFEITAIENEVCQKTASEQPKVCQKVASEQPKVCQKAIIEQPKVCQKAGSEQPKVCQKVTIEQPKVCQKVTIEQPKVCQKVSTEQPKVCQKATSEPPKVSQKATPEPPKVSPKQVSEPPKVSQPQTETVTVPNNVCSGKVADKVKELEEQVSSKSTNSVLQEHITAKITSIVNQDQSKQPARKLTPSIQNNNHTASVAVQECNVLRRKGSTSSQSSQSDGESLVLPSQLDKAKNGGGGGSHPSSPKTSSHRVNVPRTSTATTVVAHPTTKAPTNTSRSNSPKMGSLVRRMSEPGRFQPIEDHVVANRANLIQSLNAKLAFQQDSNNSAPPPATLPKPSSQRSVEEKESQQETFLQSLNAALAQKIQKKQPAQVPASPSTLPQQQKKGKPSFKESLNAKLAQQHGFESGDAGRTFPRRSSVGDAATRVRQWMASRPSLDATSCRESLLDQIRLGATLRKANTNDRSGPRIQ